MPSLSGIFNWFGFGRPLQPSVCELVQRLKPEDLQKSKDQGGHGGAIKIVPAVQDQFLFLKPKMADGAEARNYEVIKTNSALARWMPSVHGEVTVDNRPFLVMENIRKSKNGADLTQLVDIKLSKQLDGLMNPIVSDAEMVHTRGKKKPLLTRLWMAFVSTIAPGYLITNGGIRLFDYILSKRILRKSLANISKEHLGKLIADLRSMKSDMEKSGIAFIGASVVLVHQDDGSVKPILIDPAHIQCSRALAPQIKKALGQPEAAKVFYEGADNDYALFRKSNAGAIDAIIATIEAEKK